MPGDSFHQPLDNDRGLSVIEVLIAMAIVVMITGAIVGLMGAGIHSFTYSMQQMHALSNARRGIEAGAPFPGMGWQARQAFTATGLSSSQLALTTSAGLTPQYNLTGQNLQITQSGQTITLATNITALQVSYYNMSSSGLIMLSTAAASASLATLWMQTQQSGQNTYTFYSGGRMRNHL
jgi:Tfp pilus assembly protein PilV